MILALFLMVAAGALLLSPSPSPARKPTAGRRVLVLGDSITEGGYYRKIKLPGAAVDGQGWGGKQAVWIARAAAPKLAAFKPTDVVFLACVNNIASEVMDALKKGEADPAVIAAKVQRDLATAWRLLRAAGVKRVWAVKITPWAGYTKYFGAGKASAVPMRVVTDRVNAWIDAQRGQPGGPDEVIDTSALGDENGAMLKTYTKDNLHPIEAGKVALAALVQRALAR